MFGPVKYGILPDHLRTEELVAGNALVEGATFAAIIVGMVLGGFAAAEGRSAVSVVLQLIVVAVACYVTSRYIPPTGVGAPQLKVNYNPITATLEILKGCSATTGNGSARLRSAGSGCSAGITLSLVPVFIKSRIGGGIEVETAVNLFFAIGIALGIALRRGARAWPHRGRADAVHADLHGPDRDPPRAFRRRFAACDDRDRARRVLRLGAGLQIALEIVAYSFVAGMFVVPIFAAVQAWSGEDERARVIGAVNTLNAIFMVVGSLLTTAT